MDNQDYFDINKIIVRILSKQADPEDVMIFSEWLHDHPHHKQEFHLLTEFWDLKPLEEGLSAEMSFDKSRERFFRGADIDKKATLVSRRKTGLFLLSVAATILLLFSIGNFVFLKQQVIPERLIYMSQQELVNITLPDGTEVALNQNSKLSYYNDFLTTDRKVEIEGEAYFDVKRFENKRFIVQVGASQVEVLGTKFNISAYNPDKQIITTLVEGTVSFIADNQKIVMTPNQQLTFYAATGLIENRTVDTDVAVAWKDGLSRYNSITLFELAAELERNFGERIIVRDKLKDIRISGAFLKTQNLTQILNIMQNSIDFKWRKENDSILIY